MLEDRLNHRLYPAIKGLIRCFYPKYEVIGLENLPAGEPVIYVGNHCQIHGPIATVLNIPGDRYIWCAGEMMNRKEIPPYAFKDFWSFKPRWTHPFYRLLSYIIVPIALEILDSAETLPVYRDNRVLTTFRESVRALESGSSLVIFPEHNVKHNAIIYDFQDKFIDTARFYYKKSGKALSFVPMYIAPKLHKIYIGTPNRFRPDVPIADERARLKGELMQSITDIAVHLPRHTVIPYRNIPKKDYPTNI